MNRHRWTALLTLAAFLLATPLLTVADSNTAPITCTIKLVDDQTLEINLKNTTTQDTQLTFPSSQHFEVLAYKTGNPEAVWHWSANRIFTQALEFVSLKAGENHTFNLDLKGLPQGVTALSVQPKAFETIAPPPLLTYRPTTTSGIAQINYRGSVTRLGNGKSRVLFEVCNTGKKAVRLTFPKGPAVQMSVFLGVQQLTHMSMGNSNAWTIPAGGKRIIPLVISNSLKKGSRIELRCLANELAAKGMVMTLQL